MEVLFVSKMISKEEFIDFIKAYEEFEKGIENIEKSLSGNKSYAVNLWESSWVDAVGKMWDNFMYSHFTETGCDLINWWKYEDVDHVITQTIDPDLFNGKCTIQYDVNDVNNLWNYLIKFSSDYFKQDLKECKSNV